MGRRGKLQPPVDCIYRNIKHTRMWLQKISVYRKRIVRLHWKREQETLHTSADHFTKTSREERISKNITQIVSTKFPFHRQKWHSSVATANENFGQNNKWNNMSWSMKERNINVIYAVNGIQTRQIFAATRTIIHFEKKKVHPQCSVCVARISSVGNVANTFAMIKSRSIRRT